METDKEKSGELGPDIIIPWNILKYCSASEALKFRFVSQAWNQGFLMGQLHRFTVNLSFADLDTELLNERFYYILASVGKWQRFSFENFNLFGKPEYAGVIESCLKNFEHSIASIHFKKCDISMGQIIQLLSIPTKMEELRLIHCYGPYSGGLSVLSAWEYMDAFHNNVRNLKRLELVDNKGQDNPLEVWMENSTRLVELKSEMSGYPFHDEKLRDIFLGNAATLTNLTIGYADLEEALVGMAKLSLKHLKLQKCQIPNPIFFHGFLREQKSLQTMIFHEIKFKNLSFAYVNCLTSLKSVIFHNCDYDKSVLSPFTKVENLMNVKFLGKPKDHSEVQNFLSHPRPNLKTLVLKLGEGTDVLFKTVGENFPNLENFNSTAIGNIEVDNLSAIWKLKKLRRLVLKKCTFIGYAPNPGSISDLQDLKILDLSDTNASNETADMIAKLKKLTHVTLQNTDITEFGLGEIIYKLKEHIKKIDVSGCHECVISSKSADIYNEILHDCQLEVDIDDSLIVEEMDDENHVDPYNTVQENNYLVEYPQEDSYNSDDEDNDEDSMTKLCLETKGLDPNDSLTDEELASVFNNIGLNSTQIQAIFEADDD